MPGTLTANKAVVINAGGTAMTVTTGSLALAGDFSTTGAFNTIFVQQASITITLPLTADTLVGRATTDTLTNKTLTSPIMTAPVLGTPASGTLTNCTGLPVASGISGLAAGIATFLAAPSSANLAAALTDKTGTGSNVFATSPTLVTPILGIPTSGTLTNCTGLPIATGISGLAAGVATFLGAPSSANLISAMTDETGTGSLVFATNPVLVTPNIGTPSAGTLTNCTGLPILTGVSGLGTGVSTFLGATVTAITSFTPTLTFGGTSTGMSLTATGFYSRVNGVVTFWIKLIITTVGSSSGAAVVGNLPIASASIEAVYPLYGTGMNAAFDGLSVGVHSVGTTSIALYRFNGGTETQLTEAQFANGAVMLISGSYRL